MTIVWLKIQAHSSEEVVFKSKSGDLLRLLYKKISIFYLYVSILNGFYLGINFRVRD